MAGNHGEAEIQADALNGAAATLGEERFRRATDGVEIAAWEGGRRESRQALGDFRPDFDAFMATLASVDFEELH